jgi:aspartyl-tRNA(Asn)/glutamyl-tRNA(Gln) amidotransferase subunit A
MCGLVGLRPTFGVVGRSGILPGSVTLDVVGPLARTVDDTRLLLGVLVGHDPDDAGSVSRPELNGLATRLSDGASARRPDTLRLGLVRHALLDVLDPGAAEAHRGLEQRLRAAGTELVDVELPELGGAVDATWAISLGESGALAAAVADVGDLSWSLRVQLRLGRLLPAATMEHARRTQADLRAAVLAAFAAARLDALLLPASPLGPALRGAPAPSVPAGHGGRSGVFYLASLTGQPVVALPVQRGPAPLGVQLVGRPLQDDRLLDVADAVATLVPGGR